MWIFNFDEFEQKLGQKSRMEFKDSDITTHTFHVPVIFFTKSNQHIIGVYSNNPLKPLLLLFIFDTKTKIEWNYCIDPAWCKISLKWGVNMAQGMSESGIHL